MSALAGWLVAAALLVLLLAGVVRHGQVFQAPPSRTWPSVRQLQRAGSGATIAPMLDRLGAPGRAALARALRIDGLMIVPGYAGMLAVLSLLGILTVRSASSGAWEAVGIIASVLASAAALAAGGLDLIENRALSQVRASWQDVPIPARPNEQEAAQRQATRRRQVAGIDGPCRTAALATAWKLRLIGIVLVWLMVAATIAIAQRWS